MGHKVIVEILQGTTPMGSGCSGCPASAGCSPTVNVEEIEKEIEGLTKKLNEKFGDKVEMKYVDIDKVGLEDYPVMNKIMQMGYPFPITLINGEPRFAGGIMDTEIENSVEAILEGEGN